MKLTLSTTLSWPDNVLMHSPFDALRILFGYSENIIRLFGEYYSVIRRIIFGYSDNIIRLFGEYYSVIQKILFGYSENIIRLFREYYSVIRRILFGFSEILNISCIH